MFMNLIAGVISFLKILSVYRWYALIAALLVLIGSGAGTRIKVLAAPSGAL